MTFTKPRRSLPHCASLRTRLCFTSTLLGVLAVQAGTAHTAFAAPLSAQTPAASVSGATVSPASTARAKPATAAKPMDAEAIGPDPTAIKRPSNTPIPASGVPRLPSAGFATMDFSPMTPSETKKSAHQVELDALLPTEGPSALLPPGLDALRDSDLNDPYYVPTAGSGHLVQAITPMREWLRQRGFVFSLSYKGEAMGLISGGLKKGMSYVHEVTLQGIFDLQKMAGLKGWSVHTLVMERAGKALQNGRVGEYYVALQEVYSLSGNVAAHLVDFYAEKKMMNNRLDLTFGRMSLTHVFATSPLLCSFMVTCSAPVGLKQNAAMSVYPKATWGGRLRFRPTRDTAVQVGAYSVSALTDNPSGWAWGAEDATGLALPIEFTWQPFLTRNHLPGHYVIGYSHDTTRYADKIGSVYPKKLANTLPGTRSAPADMMWVEADQMMYRLGGRNMMAGGYLMAGYVHTTPRVANISDEAYGGFSMVGVIPTRVTDRFGVLYSWYHVSNRRRLSQQLAEDAGLPLGPSIHGVQRNSHIIEAYYAIDAFPGILIQPEFQYMIHPGETHRIPNATMAGLKLIANL
ncbi:carbohydrate porin [Acetobacter farinalis]|uniref:Carbohydrate porin n=1 Tax=Acetobacter farinalis TaxID=1260984 RepID=A0ABT3Q8F4_9PROT|nr:carbohydrate porin [Acetobacter farinalis]MCX2561526.1 carbohydrate porin [Acetobacter farinalis]NHO30407.1 carbohydrate porin [Acetobacter farinalis]